MKSRKFTDINFTETNGSSAKGLLVTRSPGGDVAAVAAVRNFELQHNQLPHFARRRQERRKGQALLLAVLIMLLAALLSAGFLAVVSGNLNQSARIADKTRAIEASRAGIAYANAQLSGSSQGDLWRPVDVSPAPAPGSTSPSYDFYYSQLDKVQGWAAKTPPKTTDTFPNTDYPVATYAEAEQLYRDKTYGKFPDPNQPAADAPKFLVKVREVPSDVNDPDYEADHVGEVKITSIGLSDDDPNVFHRAVAYKAGRRKSPMASALRSVSNWNFDYKNGQGGVPFARVETAAATGASVTAPATNVDVQVNTRINNEDAPQFSKENVPFNVVIVKKDTGASVRGAVVIDVTPPVAGSTVATLKLARVEAPIGVGETIQKAAAIGVGSTIDLLNTGTPVAYTADLPQPNGILANGSMWLQGQIQLSDLSKNGTKLFTSGSLAIDNTNTDTKLVLTSGDVGAPDTTDPDSNKVVASSQNNFPGNIVLTAAAASNDVKTTDLINDGWNKIGAQRLGLDYSNSRDVEPFKPVKLDNARNLARYRALTRNSADGIYIDNRGDVEKVGTAEMTQAQLMEMWTSDKTTPIFARNGAAGGASLEEKHLRGWIGPDEFMARGALIELIQATGANPSIRVTYDARSDANFNGPDPAKTLRDTNGTLQPGVYSKNVAWPKNGTLFAEGNIRIRGKVDLSNLATGANAADFPSLTVVSQGNIYIEGSVSVDSAVKTKKLMLLAKKNVIVNPTRLVLGHADEQTLATNTADVIATGTAPNQSVVIPVEDASAFKVGDVIETYTAGATTPEVRGVISARDTTAGANTLTASVLTGTTVTVASAVKTLLADKVGTATVTGSTVPAKFFTVTADNAMGRRVLLQNAAIDYPNMRLNLDHAGSRPVAATDFPFNIKTVADGAGKPADLAVKVTNKRVDANGTVDAYKPIIERDDKKLRATYNLPTPAGVDIFRDPTAIAFTDEADAKTFSLKQLEADMDNTGHVETPVTPASRGWKYDTEKRASFPDGTPAFYLAAVGLRNDKFSSAAATADNGVKDVGGTGDLDIPLATSVRLMRNGAQQDFTATYTGLNAGTGTEEVAEYTVPFLGFNPEFGVTTGGDEDVLTVDQSFYQTDADVLKSTLDSRRLATPFDTGQAIALRQNDDLLGLDAAVTPPPTLPSYRVRALKLENVEFPVLASTTTTPLTIQPIDLDIDAYVYAQEGSWFVIPGDYFRSAVSNVPGIGNLIRSDATGTMTYTDFDNNGTADIGEYVDADASKTPTAGDFADLNRNGILDPGEAEAALRFVRYNYTINFYGAIVENQTAVVADVKDAPGTTTLANGAVQDWMNKWAAYDSTVGDADKKKNFKFINYTYDPSLTNGSAGANQLRVPVTDELIYQQ